LRRIESQSESENAMREFSMRNFRDAMAGRRHVRPSALAIIILWVGVLFWPISIASADATRLDIDLAWDDGGAEPHVSISGNPEWNGPVWLTILIDINRVAITPKLESGIQTPDGYQQKAVIIVGNGSRCITYRSNSTNANAKDHQLCGTVSLRGNGLYRIEYTHSSRYVEIKASTLSKEALIFDLEFLATSCKVKLISA